PLRKWLVVDGNCTVYLARYGEDLVFHRLIPSIEGPESARGSRDDLRRLLREFQASLAAETEDVDRCDIHPFILRCLHDGLYLRVRIGGETVQGYDTGDVELIDVFIVFPQIGHS